MQKDSPDGDSKAFWQVMSPSSSELISTGNEWLLDDQKAVADSFVD